MTHGASRRSTTTRSAGTSPSTWTLVLAVVLLGCTRDTVKPVLDEDLDGDGVVAAQDCDDADASRFPGAMEVGDGVDHDCDGLAPPPAGVLVGTVVDGSGGFAVAQGGGTTWMGAPFAGTPDVARLPAGLVHGEDRRGTVTEFAGAPGDALGASLAVLDDGTLLVGAPGASAVRDRAAATLWSAPGAGSTLAARGARWAAGADGIVRVMDDDRVTTFVVSGRPSSLVILADGRVVAGFRAGLTALVVEGRSVTRAHEGDEAGLALASCDVDADGDEELVVGAPGSPDDAGLPAGAVYILDPDALPSSLADVTPWLRGSGRLGAAIACGDAGTLHLGAPMVGELAQGARYVVTGGRLPTAAEVGAPGDQLGFALATGDDAVVVGAPGGPDVAGRALRRLR